MSRASAMIDGPAQRVAAREAEARWGDELAMLRRARTYERAAAGASVSPAILAEITGWVALGTSGRRWKYAWQEVQISSTDTAVVKQNGRVGTLAAGYALNLRELRNSSSGTQGNSIDMSRAYYPTNFALQPIGGGSAGSPAIRVVLWVWPWTRADGATCYLCEYENAVDGSCW